MEADSLDCGNRHLKALSKGDKSTTRANRIDSAGGKGLGLVAARPIPRCEFEVEYMGQVMTIDAWKARQRSRKKTKHFYVMQLDSDHFLDAALKGNESRLINHQSLGSDLVCLVRPTSVYRSCATVVI